MAKTGNEIVVPLTNTGRKYGYIIWYKKQDQEVRSVLGKRKSLFVQVDGVLQEKRKRIDWKQRRISITYTVTRRLSNRITRMRLRRKGDKLLVSFE